MSNTKVADVVVAAAAKVRAPAKELMASRKRVTFGAAFINGVLGGYHRDAAKMALLGKELGLGTPSELGALEIGVLREKLAASIMALPEGQLLPASVKFD